MALTSKSTEVEMDGKGKFDVPILTCSYQIYKLALHELINDWLTGKIEPKTHIELWQQKVIRMTNDNINKCIDEKHMVNSAEMKRVYNELIRRNVPGHLEIATSHRKWLKLTFELLERIGVRFSKKMNQLILDHDLSKYSHFEVLGYAIMFGDGNGWKDANTLIDEEKIEWHSALNHHFETNAHHPEFFYTKMSDGTRDKSKYILFQNNNGLNGIDCIDESLIDMLACSAQRKMCNEEKFSIFKWLDIDDKFLERYSSLDRQFVNEKIEQIRTIAKNFMKIETNRECIQGLFGLQQIII